MTPKIPRRCKIHIFNMEWGKLYSKKLPPITKIYESLQQALAELLKADAQLKSWKRKEGGFNLYRKSTKVCSVIPTE